MLGLEKTRSFNPSWGQSRSTMTEREDTARMAKEAVQLQEESHGRLMKTNEVIEQTIQIGTETSYQLKGQGEQLQRAEQRLEKTESNIQRAYKSTKKLLKALAVDRIVIVMVVLIFLVIAAIVIIPLTRGDQGTQPGNATRTN